MKFLQVCAALGDANITMFLSLNHITQESYRQRMKRKLMIRFDNSESTTSRRRAMTRAVESPHTSFLPPFPFPSPPSIAPNLECLLPNCFTYPHYRLPTGHAYTRLLGLCGLLAFCTRLSCHSVLSAGYSGVTLYKAGVPQWKTVMLASETLNC